MHRDHEIFLATLHEKRIVILRFYSKEDKSSIIRACAPMDFGPSRRAKEQSNRYHFWDYDSDTGRHPLSLLPEQVIEIQDAYNSFDPAEFVTWNILTSPWFLERNWGKFS